MGVRAGASTNRIEPVICKELINTKPIVIVQLPSNMQAVLLSLALALGLELSLRTHLKSLALKVESLALKVESLLALILNIFY